MPMTGRKRIPRLVALIAPAAFLLVACAVCPGCGGGGGKPALVLAASVDLRETGVLQAWVDDFGARSGREVELVIAPDSEVFAMCTHGECDLAITHVADEEERLARSNYVEEPKEFMRGDYVVVGPPEDPAGVRGKEKASEAFKAIADAGAAFVLRSDGSGNSYFASELWILSGVGEIGPWLETVAEGMGEALRRASGEGAYTLSDRGSFQALAGELDLEILLEGDEGLADPYRVMVVSSLPYPDTDTQGARELVGYLLSAEARRFFDRGAWKPPPGGEGEE